MPFQQARHKQEHARAYYEKQASQAAFMAQFFQSYQEQTRDRAAQNVPIGDARRKIIYQTGQRLVDPPMKREYRKITLSMEVDRWRYYGAPSQKPVPRVP